MKMMEEMTERVTFQVTSRLTKEVAASPSANTTILKMSTQIGTLLQGAGAPKTNLATNNNNNNKGKSAAPPLQETLGKATLELQRPPPPQR